MCSKFEVVPRKQQSNPNLCDFVVNQLDPEFNSGVEKSLCSALFFQGEAFTKFDS